MNKPPEGLQIMDYPAIDDGARDLLRRIVEFFETRCDNCVTHYCEACTAKFTALILEAREFLAELPNG
jgi:hypothetical protein